MSSSQPGGDGDQPWQAWRIMSVAGAAWPPASRRCAATAQASALTSLSGQLRRAASASFSWAWAS